MKKMNKRGLSEVITTVLIILLVLAAIIIIWTVVRPTIQKSAQQINADSLTSSFSIPQQYVIVNAAGDLTFKVTRNAGEGEIKALNVVIEDTSGNRKTFRVNEILNQLETKTISIPKSIHNITSMIKSISIAPIVINLDGTELKGNIIASQSVSYPEYFKSIVSYWKFDESSYLGTTGEVKDSIGSNNGNAISGANTTTGKIGRAATFDGSDDYVAVPSLDGNGFNFSKDFSISAWVKPSSLTSEGVISSLSVQSGWSGGDNILFLDPTESLETQINGAGRFYTNPDLIPLDWTHISWTYSGSDRKSALYVNGNKGNEFTFGPFTQNSGAVFRIGRYGGGWYFKGLMDEFILFNKTLSDSEIKQIYDSQK
jgi:hypothetical protein